MILIVAEHASGKLGKSAYEMTQAARGLKREGPITLLVLGHDVAAVDMLHATVGSLNSTKRSNLRQKTKQRG